MRVLRSNKTKNDKHYFTPVFGLKDRRRWSVLRKRDHMGWCSWSDSLGCESSNQGHHRDRSTAALFGSLKSGTGAISWTDARSSAPSRKWVPLRVRDPPHSEDHPHQGRIVAQHAPQIIVGGRGREDTLRVTERYSRPRVRCRVISLLPRVGGTSLAEAFATTLRFAPSAVALPRKPRRPHPHCDDYT